MPNILLQIMSLYKECEEEKRPRILALTYPLFSLNKKDEKSLRDHEGPNEELSESSDSVTKKADPASISKEDKSSEVKEIETVVGNEEVTNDAKEDCAIDKELAPKLDENGVSELAEVKEDKKEIKREKEIGEYENLDDFDMYEKLEWKIGELESELCSRMDLAEDIDGGKR